MCVNMYFLFVVSPWYFFFFFFFFFFFLFLDERNTTLNRTEQNRAAVWHRFTSVDTRIHTIPALKKKKKNTVEDQENGTSPQHPCVR